MIFAVSQQGCEHPIFCYRRRDNGLIIDSTAPLHDDISTYGYRMSDPKSGNWWQISTRDKVSVSRSVTADYHWGYSDTVLLTNFWPLIQQRLNPLTTQVCFDQQARRHYQSYRLRRSSTKNMLESIVPLIAEILTKNLNYLVEHYQCRWVVWSQGLDTMCNHKLRPDLDLAMSSTFQGWKPAGKTCRRFDLSVPKYMPWFCPTYESAILDTDLLVIDGFYGDSALARCPTLGVWAMQDLSIDIKSEDIYCPTVDAAILWPMSWTKLKQTLVDRFLHVPRHGVLGNRTIFDPYRDINILETVLQLTDTDLCVQMNTAMIQKKILSGSGLIGNKFKNFSSSTVRY